MGLRQNLLNIPGIEIKVQVGNNTVKESKSEKLLGLIVSNDLTWKNYLYGETWRPKAADNFKGLIPKLSQRIGLLKQLRKKMSLDKFKMISDRILSSLIIYCIQVYGNVFGVQNNDETSRRYTSFSRADCNKLQVLQNKVLKLQTGLPRDFPTKDLLSKTKELSINQLIAFHTLIQMHKIIVNKKPSSISRKCVVRNPHDGITFPHRITSTITPVNKRLNLTRAGFIYRGTALFNQLPLPLRTCTKTNKFKEDAKHWVLLNVDIKAN